MEAAMPECLRQSPQQCREIQIDAKVPIEWALPLYGFLMPLIVAITILTNSFIVVVLSHRSLRTPTNFVLGAMAITELLTGLLCLPWLLYYYTFGGYLTDEWQGLPAFWCTLFPYLATSLPSIFHTAAIWLTVYLAVQRYIYICVPKLVQSLCTIRRSKQMIVSICVLSMWVYAPELFASYNQSFQSSDPYTNRTRSMCVMYQTALIQMMGNNLYHMLVFAVHTIIVHTLPCILLVFFTWRLIAAIRKADKKHCNLIGKGNQQHHQQQQQQRKFTVVTPDEGLGGSARGGAGSSSSNGMTPILAGRSSSSEEADESCGGGSTAVVTTDMPTTNSTTLFTRTSQQPQQQQRGSLSESKRVQGLRQNTRMLLAVILLFLVTEIPAALIFGMHVGTVALKFTFLQQRHYAIINKLLIVRNVLIVISYPLRFAIYCGMSAQFREVVQQMLAKRKTLFQHFSYGKLRTRGISGEVRRAGSGRKSEGGESSSNSLAHKTSTTLGMLLQTETVVWRNGVGGDAPLGGRRDEMTRLTMDHHSNGGGGRLAGQTTVLVGDEGTDDDERNVEEDEETDELDANTNYDEHL